MQNLGLVLARTDLFMSSGDSSGLKGLLIQLIIAVCILGAAACLIWCIERWISPIPAPGKTIIAIVLVICVLLWVISNFL